MAKPNAYLAQQERRMQWFLDTGTDRGMQSMIDYLCIALNDPELMGKDVWGRTRLRRLNAKLREIARDYETAFTDDPEADYIQEKLDQRLRDIFGEETMTFSQRYPYFKQINYSRGKKGWRK